MLGGDEKGRGGEDIQIPWDMNAGNGNIVTKSCCIQHMYLFNINQLIFKVMTHELLFVSCLCNIFYILWK